MTKLRWLPLLIVSFWTGTCCFSGALAKGHGHSHGHSHFAHVHHASHVSAHKSASYHRHGTGRHVAGWATGPRGYGYRYWNGGTWVWDYKRHR